MSFCCGNERRFHSSEIRPGILFTTGPKAFQLFYERNLDRARAIFSFIFICKRLNSVALELLSMLRTCDNSTKGIVRFGFFYNA